MSSSQSDGSSRGFVDHFRFCTDIQRAAWCKPILDFSIRQRFERRFSSSSVGYFAKGVIVSETGIGRCRYPCAIGNVHDWSDCHNHGAWHGESANHLPLRHHVGSENLLHYAER